MRYRHSNAQAETACTAGLRGHAELGRLRPDSVPWSRHSAPRL